MSWPISAPTTTVLYRFNPLYRGVESGLPYFGEVTLKGGGDGGRSGEIRS